MDKKIILIAAIVIAVGVSVALTVTGSDMPGMDAPDRPADAPADSMVTDSGGMGMDDQPEQPADAPADSMMTDSASVDMDDRPADAPAGTMGLEGEVTIGSLVPLSGDISYIGVPTSLATKLAVDDFNEYLEERGESWKLRVIEEDTATNPVVALDKLTGLRSKGIDLVSGPITSSNIRNIKSYADANGMVLVSCCSTAPSLAVANDNLFRTTPNEKTNAEVAARLVHSQGVEAMVLVWRGDAWGDGLEGALRSKFIDLGGHMDEGIRYNPESPEFSVTASLLNDKVADLREEYGDGKVAVFLASFSSDGIQIMQSASAYPGLGEVNWYGSDGNVQDDALLADPITREFANRVNYLGNLMAPGNNEMYESVKARVTEEMGQAPIVWAYTAYDAVWLLGKSILEAQSTDAEAIKAVLPGVAADHVGATGVTKLNAEGDLAESNYDFFKVKGDRWVLAGNYDRHTDTLTFE